MRLATLAVTLSFAFLPGIARAQPNEEWQKLYAHQNEILHDGHRLVRTITGFLEHDSTGPAREVAQAIEAGRLRVVVESYENQKWRTTYESWARSEDTPTVVLRPSVSPTVGSSWNFMSLAVQVMLDGQRALRHEENPVVLRNTRRISDSEFAERMAADLAETVRLANAKETPPVALPRTQSLLDDLLSSPSPTAERIFELLDQRFGVRQGMDHAAEERVEARTREILGGERPGIFGDVFHTLVSVRNTLETRDGTTRVESSVGIVAIFGRGERGQRSGILSGEVERGVAEGEGRGVERR